MAVNLICWALWSRGRQSDVGFRDCVVVSLIMLVVLLFSLIYLDLVCMAVSVICFVLYMAAVILIGILQF